jgi:hypothetical protein
VEQVKSALRFLTQKVCRELEGQKIPKRPVWTVVNPPDTAPYVAMDVERPALSDLHINISIGLLRLPEYETVAEAVENNPELREGIIIDAGGILHKPERDNNTRNLVTNFLWRYLGEGVQLDWDETRFVETFNELRSELRRKSVVYHTTLPLSNLKMGIDALDFSDGHQLLPASKKELERWINQEHSLPPLGLGRPQWNTYNVDRPAVLHVRQVVVDRPPPTDLNTVLAQLPRVNGAPAITALRLVMNAPISVLFQEHESEGLMAIGGRGTSWG